MDMLFEKTVKFIRELYSTDEIIPLHQPVFIGNEKEYLNQCIDTGYVSSVGEFVTRFEKELAHYCGSRFAVATSNGTSALHIALKLAGVGEDDEVITQPLTFIATINAISYCGARPVFLDVDRNTLGLSPDNVRNFLDSGCTKKENGVIINKSSGKRIAACLPMHTFGHPVRIDKLSEICGKYGIPLVEDSAESIGSYFRDQHTGTFGKLGVLSFNGNKIITAGGGGAILTDDETLAIRAKHLTTQAKIQHPWAFIHDEIGYNYRMPNVNAALCLAQLETIEIFIEAKRKLAGLYSSFFGVPPFEFISEPPETRSNYWLNSVLLGNEAQRDEFLNYTNSRGIKTRPAWTLVTRLDMYKNCYSDDLKNAGYIADRLVNLPSSYSTTY
jgi:perosamine synthetase